MVAEVPFGQHCGVGVVVEGGGEVEGVLEDLDDGDGVPSGEVGGRENGAGGGGEGAAAGDADGFGGVFVIESSSVVEEGLDGLGGGGGGEFVSVEDFAGGGAEEDGGFGAADVDAEEGVVMPLCLVT